MTDLNVRHRARIERSSRIFALCITAILFGGVSIAMKGQTDAIAGAGQLSMGETLAGRLDRALRRADDAALAERDDTESAARFRAVRERLAREIGPVRSVIFLDMPEFSLAGVSRPDSIIRARFVVRGERGRRSVDLTRTRNLAARRWRLTRIEVLPVPTPTTPPASQNPVR